MIRPRGRERPEKILIAMFKLSRGSTKPLKYEDIVVKAFRMYPEEFALRGYPEYPDSSDIHKPLYGALKRQGFIKSANKSFALTSRGIEAGRVLTTAGAAPSHDADRNGRRMTRDAQIELDRMLGSEAFKLLLNEQTDRILDTDFYQFLGCSVRTPRNDFLGRLASTQDAITLAEELSEPDADTASDLKRLWVVLQNRFQGLIGQRRKRG